MWQMSEGNGIMESECIIVLLCLISEKKKKNNIVTNYTHFTVYPDILARNRIIISINAKYLLKTDISQFTLILYFITKPLEKGKD